MPTTRYDALPIGKVEYTPEGYISVKSVVTRTGIFVYKNLDGSTRKELRLPDEVFSSKSLDTMKMIPVTVEHPRELVNADNAQALAVGFTGETVERDGGNVVVSLRITNADAIQKVKDGKREFSLGYTLSLDETPGVYNGEHYDAIQRDIEYNHLAITDEARAGSVASMRLDSVMEIDATNINKDKGDDMPKQTIRLDDNCSYEVDPQVASAFAKMRSDSSDLAAKLEAAESKLETLRTDSASQLEAKDATIAELKAGLSPEAIAKRVDSAVVFRMKGQEILGKEVNLDGKTENEVKELVVAKVFKDVNLDSKATDYASRLDALYCAAEANYKEIGQGIASQRSDSAAGNNARKDSRDSRRANAWKDKQ